MNPPLLHLFYFALIIVAIVLTGYLFVAKSKVMPGWIMLIAAILTVCFLFWYEHPIIKMLAIITTTFTGMKVVAVTESYRDKALTLKFKQWLAFSLGWAGMRAQPFETLGGPALPGAWPMARFGAGRVMAGALLILMAWQQVLLPFNHLAIHLAVSSILLIAFSLILHFGILGISAGMWRFSGVNTYVLFRQPAKATSLAEFWGKRWNLAFSEMTSIAIFRPLRNKIGAPAALMAAFIFSGLLHELALSVPVNSGYGLPMLYFILQGGLVLFEKVLIARKVAFLNDKVLARIWVFSWVILPAPLLFHTGFIREIVWPLAGLKW
jgi:alginate O-acetyltransferase complex protein AlgI